MKTKKERLQIEFAMGETLPGRVAVRAQLSVNDRVRYQVVRAGDTIGEAQSRAFWAALHGVGYRLANGRLVRTTNTGSERHGVLVVGAPDTVI